MAGSDHHTVGCRVIDNCEATGWRWCRNIEHVGVDAVAVYYFGYGFGESRRTVSSVETYDQTPIGTIGSYEISRHSFTTRSNIREGEIFCDDRPPAVGAEIYLGAVSHSGCSLLVLNESGQSAYMADCPEFIRAI
jgi:hypothetical protein